MLVKYDVNNKCVTTTYNFTLPSFIYSAYCKPVAKHTNGDHVTAGCYGSHAFLLVAKPLNSDHVTMGLCNGHKYKDRSQIFFFLHYHTFEQSLNGTLSKWGLAILKISFISFHQSHTFWAY